MPSVETARLHLRMFHLDDLDNFADLLANADVMRYVGNGPITRAQSENALRSILRHWDDHGFGRWAAEDKETQEFIGFGGLRSLMGTPEVVYHLAKPHWGRGLATELARATLRFGFDELQCEHIVAIAKPGNAASIHVMEKVGMKYEMHTAYYNIDVVQYGMSRSEFTIDSSPYILRRESAG